MPNPCKSPAGSGFGTAVVGSRDTKALRFLLLFSGVMLALPPLPLFFWVADGEPFVGPTDYFDLSLVATSGCVGVAWVAWSSVLVLGICRKRLPVTWIWTLLGSFVFGGISFVVVYCYGVDRGWFPHW